MFPLRGLRFVLCSLDLDYYSFILLFLLFLGGPKSSLTLYALPQVLSRKVQFLGKGLGACYSPVFSY